MLIKRKPRKKRSLIWLLIRISSKEYWVEILMKIKRSSDNWLSWYPLAHSYLLVLLFQMLTILFQISNSSFILPFHLLFNLFKLLQHFDHPIFHPLFSFLGLFYIPFQPIYFFSFIHFHLINFLLYFWFQLFLILLL